jgi:hypothetical protein
MHDEEEHIDFLQTQRDLIAKSGHDLHAQHHIGRREGDRAHLIHYIDHGTGLSYRAEA